MKFVALGDLLTESKIESNNPNPDRRIRVKLNVEGVQKRPLTKDVKGATKYFIRKKGQFIYGKQNLFKGAFGVVPEELDGFESTSDIPAFDVDKSCNPEWIYYYFKQNKFYESLVKYATGTGSRRIQPKRLFKEKIPLPSRDIQDEIIKGFKTHEELYEKLKENHIINFNLIEKLRQAILSEAIQGKLVPQVTNDERASIILEKIKKEKLRLIHEKKIGKEKPIAPIFKKEIPYKLPDSWEWTRIGEIGYIGTGATPETTNSEYYNGNIPWITSSSTNELFVTKPDKHITEKALKETNCKVYPKHTLIVAMYGQGKTRGQITELLIEAATNQACAAIVFNKISSVYKDYIKIVFREAYNKIRKSSSGGAQPNLNLTKVKQTLIPLPPLDEQKRIVQKVNQLMKLCDILEENIKENQKNSKIFMEAVFKNSFKSS